MKEIKGSSDNSKYHNVNVSLKLMVCKMFSYTGTRIFGLLLVGDKGDVFLQNSETHPATQHNDPEQLSPQTRTTLKSLIETHYLKL